jgi:hypothetical protein
MEIIGFGAGVCRPGPRAHKRHSSKSTPSSSSCLAFSTSGVHSTC